MATRGLLAGKGSGGVANAWNMGILSILAPLEQRRVKMKQPTEAQIKKFWERYGVKAEPFVTDTYGEFGGRVTGEKYPPIDLNNLFKYAVPKVISVDLKTWSCEPFATQATVFNIKAITSEWDKDPALALFWALWEVKNV